MCQDSGEKALLFLNNPSPGDTNLMNLLGLTSLIFSLNLGQSFRKWRLKVDSIFSSGGQFVEQSGTVSAISVKRLKRGSFV